MIRILLFIVLFIVIARVFWRFVDNVIEAAGGTPQSSHPRVPDGGVRMVRDPVLISTVTAMPGDRLTILSSISIWVRSSEIRAL